MMCDTRASQDSADEIFIAPLGKMSEPMEKAIGYLKIVTLMNEIENKDFRVKEVVDAIGRINERYSKHIIPSQSVRQVKAWSNDDPYCREYAATTTKELICVNSNLSLPNGGEWIEVCYLPEGAFSSDLAVREETFLKEREIFTLLAEIGGMIGTPAVDVEMLRNRSSDKKAYNAFYIGKEAIDKIATSQS